MNSRVLLILCLGLCGIVAAEGPAPPPPPPPTTTTTTTTTTTPKPNEWCILSYQKDSNETRTLDQTEIQQHEDFSGCKLKDDKVLCNIANKKIGDDCKVDKLTSISLYTIPDGTTPEAKEGLANWFLAHKVCVWSFPLELNYGQFEWNYEGLRATAEGFDDYTKDFKDCIFQKDKKGAVCKLDSEVSCEAKSVTIESIAAMTADAVCDKNCIGSLAEAQAPRLQLCILKFELDKSTSDVKFPGMATAMEDILEPLNKTTCKLTKDSIVFCRADDTPNCENKFRNGEITLNFFDTLEPNLTKDEISKMMQSVLSNDICLWRLTYEMDEMDQMYFDDMGSRAIDIEYREKIEACLHDRSKKMVTCRIGHNYDCGFYSIQDLSVRRLEPTYGKDKQELKEQEKKDEVRLLAARNRIGPCSVEVKHNENCSLSSVKFINYVPYTSSYCLRGEDGTSAHCWVQVNSEVEYMGFKDMGYELNAVTNGHCWQYKGLYFETQFFPNRTKGNKEKIHNLYHIFIEYEGDLETWDGCDVKSKNIEIAKDIGCIFIAGTSICSISHGEECSPNYFINGKGLDDLLRIPQLSKCSTQTLSSYFEDIPPTLRIKDNARRWELYRYWEFVPTTTEDPHAYLYNLKLDANSPGVGYPSAQIEFGDPPTQEEIAIRRSFYRGIKRVKKARISLSMLTILLPLPFLF